MTLTAKQLALLKIIVHEFNQRYGKPEPSHQCEHFTINKNLLTEAKELEEVLKRTDDP